MTVGESLLHIVRLDGGVSDVCIFYLNCVSGSGRGRWVYSFCGRKNKMLEEVALEGG